MSYTDFVTKLWKLDPGVLRLYQTRTHGLFGVGVDAVPAQDAFGLGLPGFAGMGLDATPGPGQNYDSIRQRRKPRTTTSTFPDGNASVARLLVRRLVPDAIPGSTMDDVVTARADYSKLDAAGAPVRIRLSSPVMRVRHTGPAGAGQRVEVAYLQNGTLKTVTGRAAVLACWHTVIPSICPELPAAQKAALDFAIKVPLVYTNVFIRSWTAFQKLGVQRISTPGMWHTSVGLDFPVSLGDLQAPDQSRRAHRAAPVEGGVPTRVARARSASRRPRANCSRPHSRRSSAAFAISWAARSAAVDSILRPTFSASPSTAGRTATPISTTRCRTISG